MKIKRFIAAAAACAMICAAFAGCGSQSTGDASASAAAEADAAAKDAEILVVSFGTSYNDSRDITIGAIENAIQEAYPDYQVKRAFTSQIIIDKLKERDGLEIDNVTEALDRAVAYGVKTLVVQPTHLMNGYEYTDLVDELDTYKDKFDQIAIGDPLLTSDDDFKAVAAAITSETASYDDGQTAICFMGHGTEADSNSVYTKLQETLKSEGYDNYYIGTVEATPSVDDVLASVQANTSYTKVVLEPLMVVAGDHANNDMAGDEDGSWKTTFENAGYQVECLIKGLGQFESIQSIYVDHVKAAIDSLQ